MVDNGAALTTLAVSCTVGQYEEVNAYATLELIGCLIAGQLWFTHLDHRCVRTCVRTCVRARERERERQNADLRQGCRWKLQHFIDEGNTYLPSSPESLRLGVA